MPVLHPGILLFSHHSHLPRSLKHRFSSGIGGAGNMHRHSMTQLPSLTRFPKNPTATALLSCSSCVITSRFGLPRMVRLLHLAMQPRRVRRPHRRSLRLMLLRQPNPRRRLPVLRNPKFPPLLSSTDSRKDPFDEALTNQTIRSIAAGGRIEDWYNKARYSL